VKNRDCCSEALNVITSCYYNIITLQRVSHPIQLTLPPGIVLPSFCSFYCSALLHVRCESSFSEEDWSFEKIQFRQTSGSYFNNRDLW